MTRLVNCWVWTRKNSKQTSEAKAMGPIQAYYRNKPNKAIVVGSMVKGRACPVHAFVFLDNGNRVPASTTAHSQYFELIT